MMEGWIKMHRRVVDWEWYTDSKMVHLLLHFVVTANRKSKIWKGVEIKRGQTVIGLHSLSERTGISVQSLRTCLSRLKSGGEIKITPTNKYTIITVCNYEKYQSVKVVDQQAINNQSTTNKKLKEEQHIDQVKNGDWKTDPSFQAFWEKYPRKIAGAKAYKTWHSKKCGNGIFQEVMTALEKMVDGPWADKDKKFIPHPTTWLNQERWEDEIESAGDDPWI